jgi:isochorismate synthase
MLDSVTKIQKRARTKQEFSWAIFSRPEDLNWNCVVGEEHPVIDGISKSDNHVLSNQTGFFYQPFLNSMPCMMIQGVAKCLDSVALSGQIIELTQNVHELSDLDELTSTTEDVFRTEIARIKQEIELGKLVKVVAARSKWHALNSINGETLSAVLTELKSQYPSTFIFLIHTKEQGCWIGASPEQLLTIKKSQANVMALAGTLTNDQRSWSDKEMEEQAVTHDFIGGVLRQFGLAADESKLREVDLGKVKHLLREWKFAIDYYRWFELVQQMHPTPAVAGFPQQESVDWLINHEPLDRKLYSGWLGYSDAESQELDIYVALRCGELFSSGIKIYAGCGVNLGSDFRTEWKETEMKMQMISEAILRYLHV